MSSPTQAKSDCNVETPKESQSSTTETETEEVDAPRSEEAHSFPTASYNPSVSDDEDNEQDLARIKGDAIGNTLYSERFVLSTLLKLTKVETDLSEDEGFEKDLCALWDMTIEEDVVDLLLEHNVLELLAQSIEATQDKRMTEILVGIVGNMCSVEGARKKLCSHSDIIGSLLQLISCSDSLTLVQLMRLLAVVFVYDDSGAAEIWYEQIQLMPTFVENFAFILQNSVNSTLLTHALEALNAILAKFAVINSTEDSSTTFCDIFVQEPLISGTLEAFKALMPKNKKQVADATDVTDESSLPSPAIKKTMQIFLNIHVIFAQFKETAKDAYEKHLKQLLQCLSLVLEPLCAPQYLLPLSSNEQDVVENIDEIFLAFGDPFDENCFAKMITIWNLTQNYAEKRLNRPQPANDFEADEDDGAEQEEDAYTDDMCMSILYFVTRMVRKATDEQLEASLRKHTPQTILKLIDALSAGDSEEDIKECCQKLNEAFKCLNEKESCATKS